MSGRSVAGTGEDALVRAVVARFARGDGDPLLPVGPGDDAAVLVVGTEQVVLSTDTLVEHQDFRRATSGGQDVGVKAAAQNFADIAAMGARPLALLVSLAMPGDVPADWPDELAAGLASECARAGAVMAGGDVSQAAEIVVTGTAVGTLDGLPPVRRSGARPGDVVALAGVTGPSAAGLALLESGRGEGFARLLAAHRRPRQDYPAGPAAAAAGATAMIDTSDGLIRDARRLAEASGVLLDLDPEALAAGGPAKEMAGEMARAGELLGTDPMDWVLTGGEDHALLACFPAGTSLPDGFRRVGDVRSGEPEVRVGGRIWTGRPGWTHFG